MTALFSCDGVGKSYPGVRANDDVSLTVREGEVHALLGENGAGKSTLVKMMYGLVRPDEGRMQMAGRPYAPASPHEARSAGVAMVFQHFSLFEALDVAENVALGMEHPPPMRQLAARIREVSREYGLPLDPGRTVGDLSAGERQRVEIVRCLLQEPRLLIMDEPTSVLTPQEVEILFATLRQLAAEGTAILYISHKLAEIRALCDRATILRRGKVVGTADPQEASARELAELMVGQTLASPARAAALAVLRCRARGRGARPAAGERLRRRLARRVLRSPPGRGARHRRRRRKRPGRTARRPLGRAADALGRDRPARHPGRCPRPDRAARGGAADRARGAVWATRPCPTCR